jgi:chlorite dismutase
VWEEKNDIKKWEIVEQGSTSLSDIPMVTTYSNKIGTLFSKPPLAEIAQLNLTHYARHADLIQALHIAAQPILVLKGFDDTGAEVGLSVNNAILLPPEGDALYVEPASSAFDAQRAELEALVEEMSTLGIAVLAKQKNVAESGISKTLDRIDANSMLAIISKDIEQTLQVAIDLAAEYAGIEAPVVAIDRDFNIEKMQAQEITAVSGLFTNGLIDQQTALEMLKRGEILADETDIEEVMANAETEQLQSMEQDLQKLDAQAQIAAANAPAVAPKQPMPPKG